MSLKSRQLYDDKAKAVAAQRVAALTNAPPDAPSAVAAASPNPAPDNPNPAALAETRIALVIGNGTYANVKALKNADRDASAVAASLQRLGFEVTEKHNLNLADLTKELKAFGDRAPTADWAVVCTPVTASRWAASTISFRSTPSSPRRPMSTTRRCRSTACSARCRAPRSCGW